MTPKQHPSTAAAPLIVRPMKWDDIPRILAIAQETTSCWIGPDFRSVLQSNETLGFVAAQQGRVIGFALCAVYRDPNQLSFPNTPELFKRWPKWLRHLFNRRNTSSRRIHLFAVGVVPGCEETDVERLLLKQIDADLRAATDRLEAIVPETNVLAQAVLRESGFLAIRVLNGYFLHIDGYLMARDNGTFLASTDLAESAPHPVHLGHQSPLDSG